jgi:starch synthase (maltosyl-transferring)
MAALGNDLWTASFDVDALGRYEYTVEGWVDRFGSWRHDLSKKFGVAQDVSSELLEGAALLDEAKGRMPATAAGVLSAARAVLSDESAEMGVRRPSMRHSKPSWRRIRTAAARRGSIACSR